MLSQALHLRADHSDRLKKEESLRQSVESECLYLRKVDYHKEGKRTYMSFKKICAAMAAAMILAGCSTTGNTTPTPTPETKPEVTEDPAVAATAEPNANAEMNAEKPADNLGGWEVNTSFSGIMDENDTERFKKAMEGLVGANYEPVTVLADQVVSGKNYAYLAVGKTVTADPREFWAVVTVYEDLQGNVSIHAINEIDPVSPKVLSEAPESGLMGGWNVYQAGGKPVMLPNENANVAVESVMFADPNLTLKPVAMFASQLVSGNNYLVLMRGNAKDSDVTTLYVTKIYRDLQGNAEVTDNQFFDLISYVTPEKN